MNRYAGTDSASKKSFFTEVPDRSPVHIRSTPLSLHDSPAKPSEGLYYQAFSFTVDSLRVLQAHIFEAVVTFAGFGVLVYSLWRK